MYSRPERRDRFTRKLGMTPRMSATEKTRDPRIKEMDEASIDIGMAVGRNSGFLGSVPNAEVVEFEQTPHCGT